MINKWENGLPPVGEIVEYVSIHRTPQDSLCWGDGDRLKVVSHEHTGSAPVAVVWNLRTRMASGLAAECMRPVKSEAQRTIEDLAEMVQVGAILDMPTSTAVAIAESLYDAGYRKTEATIE